MADALASFKGELRSAGLKWNSVSKLLPEWANEASGYGAGQLELRGYAARHFGLRLNHAGALEKTALPPAKFKNSKGTAGADVEAARAVATACARLVAKHATSTPVSLPSDPDAMRQEALRKSGGNWVNFCGLVDYAWSSGIPVVYLPILPTDGKKMEGMVTFVCDRPVIVLSKKASDAAWLLFILAHELAHIALGHLSMSEGQAIVDATVESEATDSQERAANRYAAKVLSPGGQKLTLTQLMNARQLAETATAYGKSKKISPGHVILNAVNHSLIGGQKPFALGQAALKLLTPEVAERGTLACPDIARKHLELADMKDDDLGYLEKLELI